MGLRRRGSRRANQAFQRPGLGMHNDRDRSIPQIACQLLHRRRGCEHVDGAIRLCDYEYERNGIARTVTISERRRRYQGKPLR
jgi:hypothetical protein